MTTKRTLRRRIRRLRAQLDHLWAEYHLIAAQKAARTACSPTGALGDHPVDSKPVATGFPRGTT